MDETGGATDVDEGAGEAKNAGVKSFAEWPTWALAS
jgi:hypothetical protein